MELKATATIKHNGKWYKAGEDLKKVNKEDGERLVKLGAAKEIKADPKPEAPKE